MTSMHPRLCVVDATRVEANHTFPQSANGVKLSAIGSEFPVSSGLENVTILFFFQGTTLWTLHTTR